MACTCVIHTPIRVWISRITVGFSCSFPSVSELNLTTTQAITVLISFTIVLLCCPRTLYQIRSVAQSCLTLCNPMNRSTPGLLPLWLLVLSLTFEVHPWCCMSWQFVPLYCQLRMLLLWLLVLWCKLKLYGKTRLSSENLENKVTFKYFLLHVDQFYYSKSIIQSISL